MSETKFNEISQWQNETFGKATALSKIAHLLQEIVELIDDLKTNNPDKRLEFADCFILLLGAASSDGMSYDDIWKAIDEKMKINKARDWGEPDEQGVVNHIRDKDERLARFICENESNNMDRCDKQCDACKKEVE